MEKLNRTELRKQYAASNRRMILLDYEGTLVAQNQASTDRVVEYVIGRLASDVKNSVAVISDRSVAALTDCFVNNPATLVAENGGFMRDPNGNWQALGDLYMMWKEPVVTALRRLAASYPGTTIAEKHFSVKWTYQNENNNLPDNDRKQLGVAFRMLSTQFDVPMVQTDTAVEYRATEVNKGKFAASWMNLHGPCDFIMAIGDDSADEDLFNSIGKAYTTIRVGFLSGSHARYYIESRRDVLPLLEELIETTSKHN